MPTYQSPGVYVEEMEAGARPIEGVGTAVAAFVGLAGAGPFNAPTLVTNWSQFTSTFGDFVEGSYLHLAVYGYFQNGGGTAYVVRIGGNGAASPAARAELTTTTGAARAAPRPVWVPSGCRRWLRARRATTSRWRSPTPPQRAPPKTPSS